MLIAVIYVNVCPAELFLTIGITFKKLVMTSNIIHKTLDHFSRSSGWIITIFVNYNGRKKYCL